MRQRRSRMAAVGTAVAAVVLAGVSMAWACTGQPLMHMATDSVGEARSHAKVEVLANQGVAGPVTLRWNSLEGPVLAQTDMTAGRAATLDATIPDAAPGVYYLVLQTSAGVARSAFEVSGAGLAASSPSAWAADEPADASGALGPLQAGVALLAVGLVGLSALTLVTVARRRTAAARTSA